MAKALVIRPHAQADIDAEAAYYHTTDSLSTATRFLAELRQVFERLVRFPYLGNPWPTTSREVVDAAIQEGLADLKA